MAIFTGKFTLIQNLGKQRWLHARTHKHTSFYVCKHLIPEQRERMVVEASLSHRSVFGVVAEVWRHRFNTHTHAYKHITSCIKNSLPYKKTAYTKDSDMHPASTTDMCVHIHAHYHNCLCGNESMWLRLTQPHIECDLTWNNSVWHHRHWIRIACCRRLILNYTNSTKKSVIWSEMATFGLACLCVPFMFLCMCLSISACA